MSNFHYLVGVRIVGEIKMSFYNSVIAALFPLLLAISTAQPNISPNSAIAQSTSSTQSQSHPRHL